MLCKVHDRFFFPLLFVINFFRFFPFSAGRSSPSYIYIYYICVLFHRRRRCVYINEPSRSPHAHAAVKFVRGTRRQYCAYNRIIYRLYTLQTPPWKFQLTITLRFVRRKYILLYGSTLVVNLTYLLYVYNSYRVTCASRGSHDFQTLKIFFDVRQKHRPPSQYCNALFMHKFFLRIPYI